MTNTALNRSGVAVKVNKSGGAHAQGDVCVEGTSTANSVINNTAGAYKDAAIWVCIEPNGVANDASGLYASFGYVPKISLSGSASLGDLVKTHTVAKQGVRHAAPFVSGDFAIVLGTGTTPAAWLFGKPDQGGGSGAPSTAKYVTTASDGTLSAEIVLPFLADYFADKAPGSPSSDDDEFDDDSIAGAWSQIGTPDTMSESTYHGKLYVQDNDSTPCGVRKSYAPGASTAFTVVVKLSGILVAAFSNIILAVETSAPADIALFGIQNNNAGFLRYRSKNGGSETNPAFIGTDYGDHHYLMLQRSASDVYALKHSADGINWYQVSSFTNSGTVANVAILMDSQGGGSTNSSMAIDFIRFFPSQTEVIGAAP